MPAEQSLSIGKRGIQRGTIPTGINTFPIPGGSLSSLLAEFVNQDIFHLCVFASVTREIPEKWVRCACVYPIQIDVAQKFRRICMCIDFLVQVLQQKNAHAISRVTIVN